MAVIAKPEKVYTPENAGMEPGSCKPQGQTISVKQRDAEMPSIGIMKGGSSCKNPGGGCYWRTDTQFIFAGIILWDDETGGRQASPVNNHII